VSFWPYFLVDMVFRGKLGVDQKAGLAMVGMVDEKAAGEVFGQMVIQLARQALSEAGDAAGRLGLGRAMAPSAGVGALWARRAQGGGSDGQAGHPLVQGPPGDPHRDCGLPAHRKPFARSAARQLLPEGRRRDRTTDQPDRPAGRWPARQRWQGVGPPGP
jgi:hypothetical protein